MPLFKAFKMKQQFLVTFFLVFISLSVMAQNYNAKIKDPKLDGKEIMIGYCNEDGLRWAEYGAYFESQYEMYEPSQKYVDKIKEKIDKVEITVVFGTWCSDSKIQVPRFYKILNRVDFNSKYVKLIGVNRDKNALSVNITDLNIERIPTFIIYQNGQELGRITEMPHKTLEKDLSKIVGKAN